MDNSLIVNGELVLYGPIGFHDFWEGTGFTAGDVVNAPAEMSGDITVRLNSGGGVASEGAAIYNSLKRHDGKVAIIVDGVAASAASLIAMAGDTITMPLGSLMMIHEPAGITLGPADAHRKNAAALDVLTGVYAQVYADRSGQSEANVRAMMKAETWLSPDDAVAKGFATAATEEGEPAVADASFDYQTYKNAPAISPRCQQIARLRAFRWWRFLPRRSTLERKPL
jgi:ATP-dependent protease ClpP protease subunit